MNLLERQLHYPLGTRQPGAAEALEIAPGVRWLRMGLPFALDHINLWLLRDRLDGREGWTVVDCGIDTEPTRAVWEQVFAQQLDGLPVLRVLVTHMHPDHIGLAHWLCERWSTPQQPCRLWISATDYNAASVACARPLGYGGENAAAHFQRHGLADPEALAKVRARGNYYASMVPRVPERFRRLLDGEAVRIGGHDWRCIAGHGHSPEHISLHCEALQLLISGDMVLPRISTNVSVIDIEPEADPLRLFTASLRRMQSLPADTLVLPSHGKPFTGLHARIAQLLAHHDERLAEVMQACAERPRSAAEILPVLFPRPLDLHQITFAMGEAIAHLHALWFEGRLQRRVDASDGVFRFSVAEQAGR